MDKPVYLDTGYIVSTPGTLGGRPRIDGHRIGVDLIADLYINQGLSVEQILEHYDSLDAAKVHAALTYYYDHKSEIQAIWKEDQEAYEDWVTREHGSIAGHEQNMNKRLEEFRAQHPPAE